MIFVYVIVACLLVVVDQLVKGWVVANVALGDSFEVIKGLMSITYIQNAGAAWSILQGKMVFFAIITSIAVVVCGYLLYKNRHGNKFLTFGLTFIIAGALGNFIDRMRLGYVVDMFQTDFVNFPIFNVADSVLVIGVICVFIYILVDEKSEK